MLGPKVTTLVGVSVLIASGVNAGVTKRQSTTSYDYIVIGGGTAGATLAARISEDPSVTVAVLEAGDDSLQNALFAAVPGADVIGVGSSPSDTVGYDWNFVTAPQAGAANRNIHYARGKGLGGSSQRNFMIYQRPTRDSFAYWLNATAGQSSPGWSWQDVYPYFTKSVKLTAPNNSARGYNNTPLYNAAAYPETDSTKAPLPVSFADYVYPYASTLRSAFNSLGYKNATDFNSGTLNGVQFDVSTIDASNKHRSSSQYFINNASKNKNLKVIINALAQKVNFDSNKKAVSVTYQPQFGGPVTIAANKEIILSAGAFQSPQLLMLSGIGPAAQLQKFNISVVVDLPGVGKNMQDHIFFSPSYEIQNNIYNTGHEAQLLNLLGSGISILGGSGSLTNPVADFLGWQKFNSSFINSKPELNVLNSYPSLWPHVEYISAPGLVSDLSSLFTPNFEAANMNKFYYALLGTIIAPQSRGSVTLKSANAADLPIIDPGWLTSPADQTMAVEIYKKVRRIFNTPAFKAVRNNDQEFYPGYNVTSDADILATIQKSLLTVWHASCTCSMQPRSNNGVLDPYLRVYGVTGLRVVDASSFPSLLPGHPQSVVYMLAERAADLLKLARGATITTTPRTAPNGDGTPYTGPN